MVNLCSEEIVRGISYVCSKNLDLLRIYIVCESSFSTMGPIKSKQRSRVTDRHLTDFLRAATTEQQPDLKLLAKNAYLELPLEKICFPLFVPCSFNLIILLHNALMLFMFCYTRIIGELLKNSMMKTRFLT